MSFWSIVVVVVVVVLLYRQFSLSPWLILTNKKRERERERECGRSSTRAGKREKRDSRLDKLEKTKQKKKKRLARLLFPVCCTIVALTDGRTDVGEERERERESSFLD